MTRLNNLLNNRHKSAFMLWQFLYLHSAGVWWKSFSQGSNNWGQVCRQQLKTLPSQWPGTPLQSASYRIETTLVPNIYFSPSSNFNPEIIEPGSHLEKQYIKMVLICCDDCTQLILYFAYKKLTETWYLKRWMQNKNKKTKKNIKTNYHSGVWMFTTRCPSCFSLETAPSAAALWWLGVSIWAICPWLVSPDPGFIHHVQRCESLSSQTRKHFFIPPLHLSHSPHSLLRLPLSSPKSPSYPRPFSPR